MILCLQGRIDKRQRKVVDYDGARRELEVNNVFTATLHSYYCVFCIYNVARQN